MDIAGLMNIFEWTGTVLTFIAAIYLCMIAKVTGWFKAWIVLAVAFFGIVVRRIIAIVAISPGFEDYKTLLLQLNSVLLLVLGILYVVAFYMLYNLFKAKSKSK